MPRMSAKNERELKDLKGFLEFYFTHVLEVDPADNQHPASFGEKAIDTHGKSIYLQGLRQAVNDTAGDLGDKSPEYIRSLDNSLREAGLITFSEVRRRFSSSYRKILKRGSISNDEEYYLITGIVDDSGAMTARQELSALEKMIVLYESNGTS